MTCQARRSTHIRYTVAVHIPTPWRHDRPPANHEGAVGRESEQLRVLFLQLAGLVQRPRVVRRRRQRLPVEPAQRQLRRLEPGRDIVRAHRARRPKQGVAHAPSTRCEKGSAQETRLHPCRRTQTATDSVADRGAAHVGQWRWANMQKQTMCMGRSPGGALFSGGRHTWRALPTFASTVAPAAGTRACAPGLTQVKSLLWGVRGPTVQTRVRTHPSEIPAVRGSGAHREGTTLQMTAGATLAHHKRAGPRAAFSRAGASEPHSPAHRPRSAP